MTSPFPPLQIHLGHPSSLPESLLQYSTHPSQLKTNFSQEAIPHAQTEHFLWPSPYFDYMVFRTLKKQPALDHSHLNILLPSLLGYNLIEVGKMPY